MSTTGALLEAELINPKHSIIQEGSTASAVAQPQGPGPGVSLGKIPFQFPVHRELFWSESNCLAAVWVNTFL